MGQDQFGKSSGSSAYQGGTGSEVKPEAAVKGSKKHGVNFPLEQKVQEIRRDNGQKTIQIMLLKWLIL